MKSHYKICTSKLIVKIATMKCWTYARDLAYVTLILNIFFANCQNSFDIQGVEPPFLKFQPLLAMYSAYVLQRDWDTILFSYEKCGMSKKRHRTTRKKGATKFVRNIVNYQCRP